MQEKEFVLGNGAKVVACFGRMRVHLDGVLSRYRPKTEQQP